VLAGIIPVLRDVRIAVDDPFAAFCTSVVFEHAAVFRGPFVARGAAVVAFRNTRARVERRAVVALCVTVNVLVVAHGMARVRRWPTALGFHLVTRRKTAAVQALQFARRVLRARFAADAGGILRVLRVLPARDVAAKAAHFFACCLLAADLVAVRRCSVGNVRVGWRRRCLAGSQCTSTRRGHGDEDNQQGTHHSAGP